MVFRAMQITVVTNESLKEELIVGGMPAGGEIQWLAGIPAFTNADVLIDLLFENSPERIAALLQSGAKLVMINSVAETISETNQAFIRINAWPTFLKGNLVEASSSDDSTKVIAEEALAVFNKKIEWLPDVPGFITPRVISMIINEGFFALEEAVSSKRDIDIAMKTGTNYPYGPFEWGQIIGLDKIALLLKKLSLAEPRYSPAPVLLKEAEL
jgi:3-hydroxybutyryl-CoA dehydrogenase